jgi:ATP-dependent Zn protease
LITAHLLRDHGLMTPDDLRFEDRQRIMPVAQHEVGHFVAARVLRFRTVGISVEMLPKGGHAGGAEITLSEALHSLEETKEYLRRRVQVLYAGALAQTLRENGRKWKRTRSKPANI